MPNSLGRITLCCSVLLVCIRAIAFAQPVGETDYVQKLEAQFQQRQELGVGRDYDPRGAWFVAS